ncbi:hypothetical protein EWU23_03565 [Cytophagaceae bacterium 50C-KIRBA]|uniref:Paeninodin family lasso peptide n=1 Tax=Aquirufa beregesia TaxID=2516556 RepID=A0ABX0EWB2_9BACT|nr:hypothetical protein [Aquirufa beregesia]NGZ43547.1 hypothetical protein [Aquirufa beregesia]
MTKTSKNNPIESPSLGVDSSTNFNEKRNWISPEINIWNSENIEAAGGAGGDGLGQTYVV